jgi:hypothetical protein
MADRLRRQWVEMTTKDFQETDMSKAIAILPVAAIEQHGPHLPVEVDTAINRGVLARTMELLPASLPVTVLPAMPIGNQWRFSPQIVGLRAVAAFYPSCGTNDPCNGHDLSNRPHRTTERAKNLEYYTEKWNEFLAA